MNVVADALSRVFINSVGTEDNSESIDFLYDHLKSNSPLPPEFPYEVNRFKLDENDTMLYEFNSQHWVPVIEKENRIDTLVSLHESLGHLGWKSLINLLEHKMWWPRLKEDLIQVSKRCPVCQVSAPSSDKIYVPYRPLAKVSPFARWGIDIIGPLPDSDGYKWIITAVDHTTRWPLARALKDANYENIARFIYEEILLRFGNPEYIISDRGPNFSHEVLAEYLKVQGIEHLKTAAYHPEANGHVERLNGVIGQSLRKMVQGNSSEWSKYLNKVLFACRVKKNHATGYSPFELVYGCIPRIPGETLPSFDLKDYNDNEILQARVKSLEYLTEIRLDAKRIDELRTDDNRNRLAKPS